MKRSAKLICAGRKLDFDGDLVFGKPSINEMAVDAWTVDLRMKSPLTISFPLAKVVSPRKRTCVFDAIAVIKESLTNGDDAYD